MTLHLFNPLTRKKEPFEPIKKGEARIYTCGPTVYNYAHIGNFRAFVAQDIMVRYLKHKGLAVTRVMNLTDVDDKTIRDSQKEGKSLKEFTEFYSEEFFKDLETLNILAADVYPKATEHINEMIGMIQSLLERGVAYAAEDGIYFSIAKDKEYGKLSGQKISQLEAGKRVSQDEYDKDNAQDFALWKYWDAADGDVFWDTPLGKGRPGWHIECSAMSIKYLGQPFDLHAGGVDLVFPHHENEIAQAECSCEEKFCNYWFHNSHLIVDGKKMSKSLGNFYTLRDLQEEDPRAIRYLLLSTHYRTQLNFTKEGLSAAKNTVDRLQEFVDGLLFISKNGGGNSVGDIIKGSLEKFEATMDDDLDISVALSVIFDFMKEINKLTLDKKGATAVLALMNMVDSVLGVLRFTKEELDKDIGALVQQREDARKRKDFATADRIRDELKNKSIILEDTPDGVKWKRI